MSSMWSSPIHRPEWFSWNIVESNSDFPLNPWHVVLDFISFPCQHSARELDNTTSVDIKQHLQSLPSWRSTVENTGIYWHWGQCGSQLGFLVNLNFTRQNQEQHITTKPTLIQLVLPLCLDCLDLRRLQASLGAWASCLGMPSLMS